MTTGTIKLAGVWKPPAVAAPVREDVLQAAFLQGDLIPVLPAVNPRVEELLRKYGGKMEAPPVAKHDPLPVSPGMRVQTFRMPRNFLTMGTDDDGENEQKAASRDPFSAPASKNGSPAYRGEFPSLGERLGGITFPDGASAVFIPKTAEMVMRNTPENLEKFAAFVNHLRRKVPVTLAVSVHVVQGNAALLRQIESRMRTLADHSSAWRDIETAAAHGDAKILDSAWLETRSGQHASCHSGGQVMKISSGAGDAPASHDDKKGKSDPSPSAGNSGEVRVLMNPQAIPVGLSLEVDPTLEKGASTMNLKLTLGYDYAPPTRRGQRPEPAGEKDAGTAGLLTFHKYQLHTGVILSSGMTRLLGMWRPEGAAEFEKGDVLQAAFIRADIVPVEEVGGKE